MNCIPDTTPVVCAEVRRGRPFSPYLYQGGSVPGESETSEKTKDAERKVAQRDHVAGRGPSAEEDAAAARGREATSEDAGDVAEHYEEMTDIGAHVKGEGEID
jgi:hypothetical protein